VRFQCSWREPKPAPSREAALASLDGGNGGGRLGPTDALKVYGAGGEQIVDAALEVT
jgi:hypothetical protein